MTRMTKVILFLAQTPNGIIARENYSEDFLSHGNWTTFVALAERIGCIVCGRITYDQVKTWPDYTFDSVRARKIVVSRTRMGRLPEGYAVASTPRNAVAKARSLGYSRVLLVGGGTVNSAFMREDLVDEIILNVEPYVLGKGIRLFAEAAFEVQLRLVRARTLRKGIVQLHYRVVRKRVTSR